MIIETDLNEKLSYLSDEQRYYIYIGYDNRILKIVEYKHWYIPIREFKFFTFDGKINPNVFAYPHNYAFLNDKVIEKPNCSFQTLQNCKEEALEILIWERFETFVYNYTRMYSKNLIELHNDIHIMDEIKIYENTKEIGQLLNNLYVCNENNYSLDDIIEKEKLKIEDKKNVLMFINTQRHNLKLLIKEKKYEEALSYIKKNHRSW
jgi:hypothetical protein